MLKVVTNTSLNTFSIFSLYCLTGSLLGVSDGDVLQNDGLAATLLVGGEQDQLEGGCLAGLKGGELHTEHGHYAGGEV